jgi:hypothetical protein
VFTVVNNTLYLLYDVMCCSTEIFVSHTSSSFNQAVRRLLHPFYKVNMNQTSIIPALDWSRRFVNNTRSILVWATTTCTQSFMSSSGLSPLFTGKAIFVWKGSSLYQMFLKWHFRERIQNAYQEGLYRRLENVRKIFPLSAFMEYV